MKIATGIIIFFLSLLALVAEVILYFIFGLGTAISGGMHAMSMLAIFFVCLMVLTLATGILAPLSALVELVTKKPNISYYIMLPLLGLIFLGLLTFAAMFRSATGEVASASSTVGASASSARTVAEADRGEREYRRKVQIKNLEVGKSVLDEHGVWGEVKNTGDRTLSEVEIKIYFLDRNGQPIFEKTYHPVLVSTSNFSLRDDKPLKPGYSQKFGVKAGDAPSEWVGRISAEVIGVKFSTDESR